MSWRFRRSFKIIPGLRLNLSKTGLSASIGGAPFTFNVGPRGLMGTASMPGTGISFRQHFSNSQDDPSQQIEPDSPAPIPIAAPPSAPVVEIRSATTESLTSACLREVKKLIQTAYEERKGISSQLADAREDEQKWSDKYFAWENGYVFKKLFKKAFASRTENYETACAEVKELEEQLGLTKVSAQFEISKEQSEPYFRMRDEFAGLCECSAIWDVKTYQATNRLRERTTAVKRLDRERVSFSLAKGDLIQWDENVPHLQNANGGDLLLYPGFILYRADACAFSVIDYHDVKGQCDLVRFQEEGGVPKDAKIVGQTWAKANKDGSQDRRFAGNYQIPIVAYGSLTFKSDGGLWEEFQFSSPERLVKFLTAYNAFDQSFSSGSATGATYH